MRTLKAFIEIKWERLLNWYFNKYRNPYQVKPYGYAPVQAQGFLPDGRYYYFRARWNGWRLDITDTHADWWERNIRAQFRGEFDNASFMPYWKVIKMFNQRIKFYEKEIAQSQG